MMTLENISFTLWTKNEVASLAYRINLLLLVFSLFSSKLHESYTSSQCTVNIIFSNRASTKEVHKDFIEKLLFYKKYISQIWSLTHHLPEANTLYQKEQEGIMYVCFVFFLLNSSATLGKFIKLCQPSFISVWTLKPDKSKAGKRCYM